ncbi:CENP-B N-terminal DNA-binding domain [Popillia japonica]|uniref:CENP-B N-terminal DNA-binding domain n=1 Tax=Popillia japonica TaxID=7064 RepID=A0AAW1NJB5_POPJA
MKDIVKYSRLSLIQICDNSNLSIIQSYHEFPEKVEEGEKKRDVAKEFKIPLSTLSTIIKHKEKINAAQTAGVRKRTTKGEFPRLEESLVIWLRQCRGQKVSISGNLLKEKAKEFASTLSIKNFAASEGWLTNFKKRNGIVFKKVEVGGESGSVDDAVCLDWHVMDDEEPAIEPLVHISGVSFSDFVQVDEDVAVSGSLTDGEILSATDTNENSNDEKAFQALFLLKKIIEQSEQQQCALKQTSLTEFFQKIN